MTKICEYCLEKKDCFQFVGLDISTGTRRFKNICDDCINSKIFSMGLVDDINRRLREREKDKA